MTPIIYLLYYVIMHLSQLCVMDAHKSENHTYVITNHCHVFFVCDIYIMTQYTSDTLFLLVLIYNIPCDKSKTKL